MFDKLLSYFNPMSYVAKMLNPGQFSSVARTVMKYAGGFLTGLGFSEGAVSSFEEANVQIIAGILSLLAGSIMSAISENKKKKD
jgi:hypothetical protein